MTRRTVEELISQANALLPDNNTQAIDPADVRNNIVDHLDTFTPMYGGLEIGASGKTLNLSTTPAGLPFDTVVSSYPPEWDANAATGVLSRTLGAVAGITSEIYFNGTLEGPQGTEVILEVYKNNAATGKRIEETMEGPTKSVSFCYVWISPSNVNVAYKLMASVSSGTASITFKDVQFVGKNIPVRQVPPAGRLA